MSVDAAIAPLSGIPGSIPEKWNRVLRAAKSQKIALKFNVKYSERPFVQELPRKRIAFMLLVHSDPAHAERLLARIYSPHHYYLLHVDPGNKNKVCVCIYIYMFIEMRV